MNFIVTALILQFLVWSEATEETSANKTKRTIVDQVQNRPVVLYQDRAAASFYAPVKPDVPKQILHGFQQTPPNAHVNHYYQPLHSKPEVLAANSALYVGSFENVAAPLQHGSLVRHGNNYAQVQYRPQYIPGKYFYINGKLVYQPSQQQPKQVMPQNPAQYLKYQDPQTHTQKFVIPNPSLRPANVSSPFYPSQPFRLQSTPKVEEEENEDEPQKQVDDQNKENEEVEEETEEQQEEEYNEEEEEEEPYYSKCLFEDEHDEEHEDDENEDNERDFAKITTKMQRRKTSTKPNKHNWNKDYKYGENYDGSSIYKKMRTKSPKPFTNKIESKQSRNIPTLHKEKIFREKWLITKSTDDSSLP